MVTCLLPFKRFDYGGRQQVCSHSIVQSSKCIRGNARTFTNRNKRYEGKRLIILNKPTYSVIIVYVGILFKKIKDRSPIWLTRFNQTFAEAICPTALFSLAKCFLNAFLTARHVILIKLEMKSRLCRIPKDASAVFLPLPLKAICDHFLC